MRFQHALLAALLSAGLLPSGTASTLSPGSPRPQQGSTTSPPDSGNASTLPEALSQYPGAPFEDREGAHWFSTVFAGLVRLEDEEFTIFTTEDGLAGNVVRDIIQDKEGRLWIATSGGVSRYDGRSFTTVSDYGDTPIVRTFSKDGNHRDVWDLLIDRNGLLWITTLAGVFRYEGGKFVSFPLPVVGSAEASEFTPKFVYSLFEDEDGTMWFGTDGAGAVSYDGETMTVYTAKEHGLCSNRICRILRDRRGDLWFGTSDGGVSRYDGTTFTTHLRSSTHSVHTGWGRFMAIHEDRAGNLWFGAASAGGGVHRYDGKAFRFFSQKDGLGDGGVPSISEDRSGKLWLGTTTGVFHLEGDRFVALGKQR